MRARRHNPALVLRRGVVVVVLVRVMPVDGDTAVLAAAIGLVQLISKLVSGLPGIVIAVTHLVCALSGAPGPTQAANAAEDGISDAAPSNAVATVLEKCVTNFL
jgi:hypothetical protein